MTCSGCGHLNKQRASFCDACGARLVPAAAPAPRPLKTGVAGRECFHCKQIVQPGDAHDCWTTTETALTKGLPEDLREAWERIRETAADFGEQRIYASHHSIMFSRKACYFFVRPKTKYLEVCVFLGRTVTSPLVHRADQTSKTKIAHMVRITHRDQVEAPFTDWLREAYDLPGSQPKVR